MKHTTIRNAFAALTVAFALGSTAAQAASIDNREIGHFANAQTESVNLQGLTTGQRNGQIGHFAAEVGNTAIGFTAYGDTRISLR